MPSEFKHYLSYLHIEKPDRGGGQLSFAHPLCKNLSPEQAMIVNHSHDSGDSVR